MRLNIHPLNLCDGGRETLEATDSDVRVGVAEHVESAAWRVELRAIIDIGLHHRIDIEGYAVVCCGGTRDPSCVLCDEKECRFAWRQIFDCEEVDFGGGGDDT